MTPQQVGLGILLKIEMIRSRGKNGLPSKKWVWCSFKLWATDRQLEGICFQFYPYLAS